MHKLRAGLLALLCLGLAAGCATNTSPGNILDTTKATLQMALGTLNDSAGTISSFNGGPGTGTYLNVVATFRNQNGVSAFAHPGNGELTGPGSLSLAVGGLFSYGQAPLVNGTAGMPPAYNPPNSTGGGYATGFVFTGAPPTFGTYTLTATLSVNGETRNYPTTATLPASPTVLGPDGGGSYVADSNGDGGGTFTFATPPAGVTESVVYIACAATTAPPDPCSFGAGTAVASAEVKTGTLIAVLPPGTLVSGDPYNAVVLGADYPLVEAGPPTNVQVTPALTGSSGTCDLSASALVSLDG